MRTTATNDNHAPGPAGPVILFRRSRLVLHTGVDLASLSGRELDATVSAMPTADLEALLWERRQAGVS